MQESINLQLDTSSWIDVTRDIRASLSHCHIVSILHSVSLAYAIIINRNLTWQFYAGSGLIDPKKTGFPVTITIDIVIKIFDALKQHAVCPGNPDEAFMYVLVIQMKHSFQC